MKVLITHERFMPDYGGGGEYVAFNTAKSLQMRGVEVQVLTTGDPTITEYEGIPTSRLKMPRHRMNLAAGAIARAAEGFDLIQTFNYHACLPSLVAGRRIGKPVVCTILGLFQQAWNEMRGRLVGPMYSAWERFMVRRRFDRIIFLSDYSRELGIRLGARPEFSLVNSPGIDPERFKAVQKDTYVLYAGKYERRKGVYDVVEVARSLPNVEFRMTGWGPDETQLQAIAPGNVRFLGPIKGAELVDAFSRASVFLCPTRAETFGIAVAEAMAAGCIIVSTIPLGYEGAVVRPGDISSMTEAVRLALSDPGRTSELGTRNRAKASVFTWERNVDFQLKTYREVLSSRR